MFEKEKRKGVPTRGLLYLVAGIAIGVVGMMGVMMIGNRGVKPDPTRTILPVIPTPAMGVTGTALAQTVPTAIPGRRLLTFTVDEKKGMMALSYENDSIESVVQVRPWSAQDLQKSWLTVERGPIDYDTLFFDPQLPQLIAMSSTDLHVDTFDLSSAESEDLTTKQVLYRLSADGKWLAAQSTFTDGIIVMRRDSARPVNVLQTQGLPIHITFSPDSQMIAVVSVNNDLHQQHVEVFRLPDVTPVRSYTFEGMMLSPLIFSPDNIHMAIVVDRSIRLLSVDDDEQRYFDVGTPIQHLAIDPTGKWLAVSGKGAGQNDARGVTVYPLEESVTLPPAPLMVQSIGTTDDVIGLQFVEEGLLVGQTSGTIKLWQWVDDVWRDPITLLENFE